MDIDFDAEQPPDAEVEEPWLDPAWFQEPWLDRSWTEEPWPPAWTLAAAVPHDIAARRQRVLDEVGRAVLQLRLVRNWSQHEVELRSGVDQTTISRLERGQQRDLSLRALAAILEALKTDRIHFLPPSVPIPTTHDLIHDADRWRRAGELARWRLARSKARSARRSKECGSPASGE